MAFYKEAPKGRSAGVHPYTKKDMERVGWCLAKNIKVAVVPYWDGGVNEFNVEISINNKVHLDPSRYTGYDAQTKMYEYYKYYYDKNI